MQSKLLQTPEKFREEFPDVWQAFARLGDECHNAGTLDEQTRRLVKIALAVGAGLKADALGGSLARAPPELRPKKSSTSPYSASLLWAFQKRCGLCRGSAIISTGRRKQSKRVAHLQARPAAFGLCKPHLKSSIRFGSAGTPAASSSIAFGNKMLFFRMNLAMQILNKIKFPANRKKKLCQFATFRSKAICRAEIEMIRRSPAAQ